MQGPVRRLSLGTMAAYGFGQTAEGIKNAAFNTFVLFYYQQVVGVSGTLTGIALAIALCFDAVTDPLAGAISDKAMTRWGRRHPFMLAAAIPLSLSFFFLFNPPDGLSEIGSFLWLALFAVLVRGSMTFYHIPHLALGAEMAMDYNQRSTLFAFSTLFSLGGGVVTGFLAYTLFFPTTPEYSPGLLNPAGYVNFSTTFAIAMAISIAACVFGTRKEIRHLRQPITIVPFGVTRMLKEIMEAFRNRSFRALFFGMMLGTMIISIEAVLSPFMGLHFWGFTTEQLAMLPLVAMVGLLLSLPLTPIVTRALDKKLSLIVPAALAIINGNVLIVLRLLDVPWFPTNESPWMLPLVMVTTFITATIAPVIFTSINSMFADIADEHELDTGERREGVIYAARAFCLKATGAAGVMVGGVILDFIAFPRAAPAGSVNPDTIWMLGLLQGPATSVFSFFGLLLYATYRLNRARHAEILEELERRRAAAEEG
ncbi:MAG: MFS transporter [Gammaproteobacteria bacterium]|nr:MFS transporter [Gammaproteobacteria bacterium]